MKINLRNTIRIFFLVFIFVLWFTGNIYRWGPFLGVGLLAIPFWGRIFCGWMCPISTTIDIFKPILKITPLKYDKTLLSQKSIQILLVIISFLILVFFNKTGFIIPFFIALIPVGLIVSFFLGEAIWHHCCFIGIIYSWFGNWARRGYFFQGENCLGCKACTRVCPNNCIELKAKNKPEIDRKNCLVCGKCKAVCPPKIIEYGLLKSDPQKSNIENTNNLSR